MTTTREITFNFADGRPREDVTVDITEQELQLLAHFLAEALVLQQTVAEWGGIEAKFSMSATVGQHAHTETSLLSQERRATLLHLLRPFLLEEEPFTFHHVRGILARSSDSEFLRDRLKRIKQLYAGKAIEQQFHLQLGDVVVKPDRTLLRWLNGFEYHRDQDAREEVDRIRRALPAGFIDVIFHGLLHQKVNAILHLAHIIQKIVEVPLGSVPPDA